MNVSLRTRLLKLSQKWSIGEMSGLFACQSKTPMPLTVRKFLVTVAVWGLALSCWNMVMSLCSLKNGTTCGRTPHRRKRQRSRNHRKPPDLCGNQRWSQPTPWLKHLQISQSPVRIFLQIIVLSFSISLFFRLKSLLWSDFRRKTVHFSTVVAETSDPCWLPSQNRPLCVYNVSVKMVPTYGLHKLNPPALLESSSNCWWTNETGPSFIQQNQGTKFRASNYTFVLCFVYMACVTFNIGFALHSILLNVDALCQELNSL